MGKPVKIREIIIELNMSNLVILRDALSNYHKYLKDVQEFEHDTHLTKNTIKRRIRYLEDFIEALEVSND